MSTFSSIQPKQKIESLELNSDGFTIQARNTGVVAAILGAINLGSKSYLQVDARGATVKTTGFSCQTRTYIPLFHTSATVYRYGSPTGFLLVAGFFGFSGLTTIFDSAMAGSVLMILGLLFMGLYVFGPKAVVIGIVSDAGTVESLRLEAKGEQLHELQRVADWLEGAVAGAAGASSGAPIAVASATGHSMRVAPTTHSVRSERSL